MDTNYTLNNSISTLCKLFNKEINKRPLWQTREKRAKLNDRTFYFVNLQVKTKTKTINQNKPKSSDSKLNWHSRLLTLVSLDNSVNPR